MHGRTRGAVNLRYLARVGRAQRGGSAGADGRYCTERCVTGETTDQLTTSGGGHCVAPAGQWSAGRPPVTGHPVWTLAPSQFCPWTVSVSRCVLISTVVGLFVGDRTTGGHVLVTEFRGMALNGLFCADVLQSLDLDPLADFTYKCHPVSLRFSSR